MVRSDSVVVLTLLKSSSWSSHTQKNMKTEKKNKQKTRKHKSHNWKFCTTDFEGYRSGWPVKRLTRTLAL